MIYDDDRDNPITERIRPQQRRWPQPTTATTPESAAAPASTPDAES